MYNPRISDLRFCAFSIIIVCFLMTVSLIYLGDTLKNYYKVAEPKPVRSVGYITATHAGTTRLGNLMFMYATMLGVAEKLHKRPVFDIGKLSSTFELTAPLGYIENRLGSFVEHYTEYGRRASAYDREVFSLEGENIMLHGYWQSWKYFEHVKVKIRTEFRFKKNIETIILGTIEEIRIQHPNRKIIGIHVRRGDMAEGDKYEFGYTVAPASYIKKAMAFMEMKHSSNVVYVVASDDLRWCNKNIKKRFINKIVLLSPFRDVKLDMALISHCDHVIITVGTYGWWGAWLANGTTTYYSKWPRPNSQLEYQVEKKDYFPPNWVALGD